MQAWRGGPDTEAWRSASLSRPHPWPSFLGTVAAFVILFCQDLWPWSFDFSWLYLLFISPQRPSCTRLHFSTMQSVSMCESWTAVCSALARSTFQNKFSSQCDVLKAFVSLVWVFYLFLFIDSSTAVWSYSFLVYCLLTFMFLNLPPSYLYLLFPHPPIFSLPNSQYPIKISSVIASFSNCLGWWPSLYGLPVAHRITFWSIYYTVRIVSILCVNLSTNSVKSLVFSLLSYQPLQTYYLAHSVCVD